MIIDLDKPPSVNKCLRFINPIGDLALLLLCKTMQTGMPMATVLICDSLDQ